MDAWQPYTVPPSTPQYHPVPNHETGSTSSSGFTRVGGGRAHMDSPFAISGQQSNHSRLGSGSSGGLLPTGAMAAATPGKAQHARIQSHAAVVETVGSGRAETPLNPPRVFVDGGVGGYAESSESSLTGSPDSKKAGFWNRRADAPETHRQDTFSDEDFGPQQEEVTKSGSTSLASRWFGRGSKANSANSKGKAPQTLESDAPSSSFVVVRNKRPSQLTPPAVAVTAPSDEDHTTPKQSSFVVVRPQRNSVGAGGAPTIPARSPRREAS